MEKTFLNDKKSNPPSKKEQVAPLKYCEWLDKLSSLVAQSLPRCDTPVES